MPNPSDVNNASPSRERQHGHADMYFIQTRQRSGDRGEQLLPDKCNGDCSQTAAQSEKQIFYQNSLAEVCAGPAPRADRRAVSWSRATLAGDLKIRQIYARHQQHTRDRSQQEPERLACVSGNLLRECLNHHTEMDRKVVRRSRSLLDSVKLALRLRTVKRQV